MPFHIQCLKELLFLCVIVFPSAYIFFLKPFVLPKGNRLLAENLSTVMVYGALTAFGVLTGSAGEAAPLPGAAFFVLAAALGIVNVGMEYVEAALPVLKRNGSLPRLRPASIYRGTFSLVKFLSIIAAAAAEELVFRQFMIGGILNALHAPLWLAVLLSSFYYALNHVYFGRFAVLQKMTSGLVFSLLYVCSGGSVAVSALCHICQNLFLYFYSLDREKPAAQRKEAAS